MKRIAVLLLLLTSLFVTVSAIPQNDGLQFPQAAVESCQKEGGCVLMTVETMQKLKAYVGGLYESMLWQNHKIRELEKALEKERAKVCV